MRWADDSSSDEEDMYIPPASNQLNDGFISAETANQITRTTGLNWGADSSEEEEEEVVDDDVWSSSSSSESEEEDDEPAPRVQVAEAVEAPKSEPKKPLTKKEKQALKAKELDDLDALLNEFGVSESTPAATTKVDGDTAQEPEGIATTEKKKKKRNKKKKNGNGSGTVESSIDQGASTDATVADVVAVLRAKNKPKQKSAAEIAAATAAKEAKKKSEIEAKKKKKKKKKPVYEKR
eukprot:CAMPEP_0196816790 /NCGR_PEP_ID=MMETSP1362-20130617/57095_1 /TAXON_ID=163516 /ORGANISM="Leptocylindrus danicus, Strain CCMP1856" /LENGTH=235 /DNA_ID=CAMNT_0042194251 /DNA_START=222 /DNA_END=929 /DNA_ORIENTATION=-